jgi:hypothetical protein
MSGLMVKPPPPPREHGAWMMLCLPLLLGGVLAGPRLSASWLLPPAVFLVFLAHYAVVPVARRRLTREWMPVGWKAQRLFWAMFYLVVASLLFALLVVFTPVNSRPMLLWISGMSILCGTAYSAASAAGAGRALGAELLGMAAMALSAPVMALAAGEPPGMWLVGAPALAFGYSVATLSWVRAYTNMERGRMAATLGCAAAHLVVLGALGLIARAGWLLPWALLAFVPVLIRTASGLIWPPPTLRAVGLREIWVALSFAAIAVALI